VRSVIIEVENAKIRKIEVKLKKALIFFNVENVKNMQMPINATDV
jgi:hypothetical protein